MFRNYFKTAVRNLLRYKGFAVINIASLTIGIMGCLVIGLFVWDERQYDKDIPGGENIYRIYEERNTENSLTYSAVTPPRFTTFLQQQYPEVSTTARMMMTVNKFLLERGEVKNYEDKGWFVDSSFFNIFPLTFLKGDRTAALSAPATVVISEDIANRFFGKEDPIGKTIKMDKSDLTVKAVFAKLPAHFHLDFNYLISLPTAGVPARRMERWTWHQFYSYVKLKPGTDIAQLQNKFQAQFKKEAFPDKKATFFPFFQSLKNIHLQSADFIYDNAIRGNETYVKALTIIALFVLVIACFNFVNLAIARSLRRAKEIGVRKVIGAQKKQLVAQFIGETVLLSVFSMLIAIVGTLFIVPLLNGFTGKTIAFNPVTNPLLGAVLLIGSVVIGMLAGIYPALVLSGFKPVTVLKSMKLTRTGGGSWLRPALVVIQFSLSILLIVSTAIVYRQTQFLNNKDLGFNKEQLLYFQTRGTVEANLETFKNQLRQLSGVVSVTSGYGLPGDLYAGDGVIVPGKEGDKNYASNVFIGDYDYAKTLGLRVIAGRDFSRDMSTDISEAFLINETGVKEFGFDTPEKAIGRRINWDQWSPKDTLHSVKMGKVIGVVQDFHYKSLHEKVTASVIQLYPQEVFKVAVKLKQAGIKNTIAQINTVWNQFSQGYPLDYRFMDETYGQMYTSEQKLSDLLWIFTILAIVVSCMGLFGLAAFTAEQRTRELGIRKVLGASVVDIVGLLSKNFLLMVIIAAFIAFPVAWLAMNNWLKDFPYRVSISWWIFGIAIVSALLIAFITVSFQSIKAAVTNPVKNLRVE